MPSSSHKEAITKAQQQAVDKRLVMMLVALIITSVVNK